jgi:hypothetical protein
MTTMTKPARIANTTPATSDAEQLLRDAAFILRLTRKVKAELLVERPEIARVAASRSSEAAAGLGV